ncbi:MAG: cupin domain-containing protein [Chloroflexota bacterium]
MRYRQVKGRKPRAWTRRFLAYSGISVKMLVDKGFGADLLTCSIDYEHEEQPGPRPPFEEDLLLPRGRVLGELDGKQYTLRAGDVIFASVGSVHGFYNNGTERVRWLETQAPQPPTRHSYRWVVPDAGPGQARALTVERAGGGADMANSRAVVVVGGTRAVGMVVKLRVAGI